MNTLTAAGVLGRCTSAAPAAAADGRPCATAATSSRGGRALAMADFVAPPAAAELARRSC